MMKRVFKLLLFLGFVIPVSTNAASVSIDCPETAKALDDVTCKINLSTTERVVGFQADVSATAGLTYKFYSKTSGWGGTSSATRFLLYDNAVEGNVELGTYTYSVDANASGNLSFTLNNIVVSDANADPVTVNNSATDTVRIISGVNTLSSLTASGATFTFSPDTTTYNLTINSDKTTINATATDSKATITGTGEKNLNIGSNKFEIVVTSELGTKKTYTLNITRNDTRSSDNTLSKLELDSGTINFNSNTTTYNVEVDVASINVTAVANHNKATVTGAGKKDLNYGNNKIEIVVTAENGSKKTYTLNITRKDTRSTDNTLSKIEIDAGTINFKSDVFTYNIDVLENVTSINVTAVANHNKATVTGAGKHDLKYGNNKIEIVVTAENGSKKTYTLNVNRKDNRSGDNKLKSLSVSEGKIDFSSDKTEYKITLSEDIKEITFSAEASDSKAKVEGIGTKKLELGKNNFVIKVTSENETVREYRIIVVRGTEEVVNVPNTARRFPVIISILGIILVGVGSVVIYRTKHN